MRRIDHVNVKTICKKCDNLFSASSHFISENKSVDDLIEVVKSEIKNKICFSCGLPVSITSVEVKTKNEKRKTESSVSYKRKLQFKCDTCGLTWTSYVYLTDEEYFSVKNTKIAIKKGRVTCPNEGVWGENKRELVRHNFRVISLSTVNS